MPGISSTFGARRSSQASAACIGLAPSRLATSDRVDDCSGEKAAERKERHIGDAVARQRIDQRVVGAMGEVVVILHADDRADAAGLGDLAGRDAADADMAHQAFALQLGEDRERLLDRAFGGRSVLGAMHAAEVDDVDHVAAKIAQIVVHRLGQLGGREGGQPRGIGTTARADLSPDDQVIGVGIQRLADDLVGDVRAVEVAGVDVVHAGRDGRLQDGASRLGILGRAEDVGPGQLHGAVAQPPHGAAAEGEGAGFGDDRGHDALLFLRTPPI